MDESASAADIRRAYRGLALQFHPDRNRTPEAPSRFMEISQAYQQLKRLGYLGISAESKSAPLPTIHPSGAGSNIDIGGTLRRRRSRSDRRRMIRVLLCAVLGSTLGLALLGLPGPDSGNASSKPILENASILGTAIDDAWQRYAMEFYDKWNLDGGQYDVTHAILRTLRFARDKQFSHCRQQLNAAIRIPDLMEGRRQILKIIPLEGDFVELHKRLCALLTPEQRAREQESSQLRADCDEALFEVWLQVERHRRLDSEGAPR